MHCWLCCAVFLVARGSVICIFCEAVAKKLSELRLVEEVAGFVCVLVLWCKKLRSILHLARDGNLWTLVLNGGLTPWLLRSLEE